MRLEHEGDAPFDRDCERLPPAFVTIAPVPHAAAKKLDPDNRLLWRQRLRRLEAEAPARCCVAR